MDAAVSGDRNVIKKEAEKILKYEDLITEIQSVWNLKAKMIPVIIGATGTISKSLRQYLNNKPGKYELRNYKQQPYLSLHTHYESANVNVQNTLHGRSNITCSTNCKYRTAVTLYRLETWFVSGMYL